MASHFTGGIQLPAFSSIPENTGIGTHITVHWRSENQPPTFEPISKPPAVEPIPNLKQESPEPTIEPVYKSAKYPQWYAVATKPSKSNDPLGYLHNLPVNPPYHAYARLLGIDKSVIKHLKHALKRRYWNKENLLDLNYNRKETRERLAEEINIGMRNYATLLTKTLRAAKGNEMFLRATVEQWKPWDQLSNRVYTMGNYQLSGYLLYKTCEGLMEKLMGDKLLEKLYAIKRNMRVQKKKKKKQKIVESPLGRTRRQTRLLMTK
ncbi:hypothetical protein AA313_de0205760 [Arthrobotrys entomopaga]|nr:hypothetical protein AA313_de0205760 [Arthrobotrys entomopaga]